MILNKISKKIRHFQIFMGVITFLSPFYGVQALQAEVTDSVASPSFVERKVSSKSKFSYKKHKRRATHYEKIQSHPQKLNTTLVKLPNENFPILEESKTKGILGFRPTLGASLFTLQGSENEFFEINGVDSINLDYVPGLAAGVQMDLGFGSDHFIFETGLYYLETGAQKDDVPYKLDENKKISVNYQFQYVALPMNAKYLFTGYHNSSMYLKFGLTPIFFSGLRGEINRNGQSEIINADGGIKDLDILLNMGLGGQIQINKNSSIFVEASFFRGMVNLTEQGSAYNQGMGLFGGFSIQL